MSVIFLGIQFPFFQLMMTLLVVSVFIISVFIIIVFIISVMNPVLNISVITEAHAPQTGSKETKGGGPH